MSAIVTPAFVVDEKLLTHQVEAFRGALTRHWPRSVLSYSVKTNSLPWLVAWMARHQVPAEVVSQEEWELALAVGHAPERIVVNGPAKTRELLDAALDAGALTNLDSRREVRWVLERAATGRRVDTVGLRVNWDVNRDAPNHTASGAQGLRFGFHIDNGDLDEVVAHLTDAGVRVAALHLHVTSLTRALDTYVSACRTAARIIERYGLELDWIDLGGGFYGGDSPDFPTPDSYLETIRAELDGVLDPSRTTLVLEPGAALVAVPVEFHTSVIDSHPVGDHLIVVTDGSRTNLDTCFRKSRYQHEIASSGASCISPQVICGFTCLDNDRIMTLTAAPKLAEGDRIVYRLVGSYTMTFNPLFIHFLPRVYARRNDGTLMVVRQRWGVTEYLAGNRYNDEVL